VVLRGAKAPLFYFSPSPFKERGIEGVRLLLKGAKPLEVWLILVYTG
jgi:hypothetical protein